jgi:hypothetical protein
MRISSSDFKRYAALAAAIPFVGLGWILGLIFRISDMIRAAVREGFETGSKIE